MTYVRACFWHKTHRPKVYVLERHHVLPKANGGPSTAANLTDVDADMHNGVHEPLVATSATASGRPG